jgi:pimeloyl-ACP methyl ester carboxylesterase
MHRGYISAPWGQIHYAEAGRGVPVVLYPNRPRSWIIYQRLAELLAGKHRVVILDPPGCGASDPLPSPIELGDLTRATLTLMDGLGIDRAHISGHHTGATVAVDIAAYHPERALSIAPSGLLLLTAEEKAARLDGSAFSPAAGNPPKEDGSHLDTVLAKYPPKPPEDLSFINDWTIDGLVSEASQAALAMAVYRYDERSALARIAVPTLLVQSLGPGEPGSLQRMADAQRLVPGSRLEFVDGGDVHFIHHRADELAPLLLQFFTQAEQLAGVTA